MMTMAMTRTRYFVGESEHKPIKIKLLVALGSRADKATAAQMGVAYGMKLREVDHAEYKRIKTD